MRSTTEASTVSSALLDLRQVPLAEMPTLGTVTDKALARVLPDDLSVARVRVAAFNSAI
jgi:FXSXX-COOH protein